MNLLGIDVLGCDLFLWLVYGVCVILFVGLIGVIFVFVLGLFFGLILGYYGGIFDSMI